MEQPYKNLNPNTQRKHREKEERSALERFMRDYSQSIQLSNYLLMVIAMILIGMFIRSLFS